MSVVVKDSKRGWRLKTVSRRWSKKKLHMAVAPGCPVGAHPLRWCECKPHRTREAAEAYITARVELAARGTNGVLP